jgi:voltage-gated potassium channel
LNGIGKKQFVATFTFLQVIFATGVAGFMIIEDYSLLEAIYMTSITLSTVGYKEVRPLSSAGQVFTTGLITVGVISIALVVAAGSRVIIEGQLERALGRRKMKKEISRLKNHFIVCGYGRMGKIIGQELKKKSIPFVVVESSPEVYDTIGEDILAIKGNATQDAVLQEARITEGRGLVSVVSTDSDNVYITLTARGLSSTIYIVARAGEEGSEKKLLRAGADKVVSPYIIGGSQMANAILRPTVVDFIELVTQSEHLELQMEEVEIKAQSPISCSSLLDSGIRQNWNIIVVAIKKGDGHMVFNPASTEVIEAGDRLIILGDTNSLAQMEESASGKGFTGSGEACSD